MTFSKSGRGYTLNSKSIWVISTIFHQGCIVCDLVSDEECVLPEHEPPAHVALVEVLHLLQVVRGVHEAQDDGAHDGEAEADEEDVDLLLVNVRPGINSSAA